MGGPLQEHQRNGQDDQGHEPAQSPKGAFPSSGSGRVPVGAPRPSSSAPPPASLPPRVGGPRSPASTCWTSSGTPSPTSSSSPWTSTACSSSTSPSTRPPRTGGGCTAPTVGSTPL